MQITSCEWFYKTLYTITNTGSSWRLIKLGAGWWRSERAQYCSVEVERRFHISTQSANSINRHLRFSSSNISLKTRNVWTECSELHVQLMNARSVRLHTLRSSIYSSCHTPRYPASIVPLPPFSLHRFCHAALTASTTILTPYRFYWRASDNLITDWE